MSSKLLVATASLATALTLALAGCGGDHALEPDEGAARFDSTFSFRDNRLLALLTFEGGLIYGLYQSNFAAPTFPEYAYAGFFTADLISTRNGERFGSGAEYRFDERDAVSIDLQLAAASGDNVFGTVTQTSNRESSSFSAQESTNSKLPTDLTSLSGAYSVQARSSSGSFKANGSINSNRRLSVSTGTCSIDAALSPRERGNLYDAVATIGPGCEIGEGNYKGHALQAYVIGNVYIFLSAPGRSGIMILLGKT